MHRISFYQIHLTEGQWSYINKVFFENDYRHRKYSLRSIFEAILYLLVNGCQWRMLPHDLPKWQTVYWYFRKWGREGYLNHCIEKLVMKIRRKRKQSATPSVMELDALSVKWSNRQSDNDFDANKKVKGINATSLLTATGSSSAGTFAVPEYMIPGSHLRCVNKFPEHGLRSGKDLPTAVIAVNLLRI